MIRNSFICKLINVQASMKENNENEISNCDEISKLTNAPPKDTAALDKRSVLEWRSAKTIRRAPDKTGNVNKSIAAVIKRAQGNNGIVFNVRQ